MRRLQQACYFLLLFLLPIDGTEFLRVQLEDVRVQVMDLALLALLYLDFLSGAFGPLTPRREARLPLILAGLAAALSLVSLIWTPMNQIGWDVRMSLHLITLAALIYVAPRTFTSERELDRALGVVALSLLVVSAATVAKSLGVPLPGGERMTGRLALGPFHVGSTALSGRGVAFNVAMLGAFPIVLLMPMRRWWRLLGVSLLLFASALSYSRGLWVGLVAEMVAAAVALALRRGGVARRLVSAGLAMVIVGLLVAWGPTLLGKLISIRPTTIANRLMGYRHGLELVGAGPRELIFGVGRSAFREEHEIEGLPHNIFLDLMVAKGLATTLVFAGLIAWLLTKLARRIRDPSDPRAPALFAGLVGILTAGMVAPIIGSLAFVSLLALAAAALAARPTGAERWA